jgi:CubicO group peptidase (beta-lactamase class C family)
VSYLKPYSNGCRRSLNSGVVAAGVLACLACSATQAADRFEPVRAEIRERLRNPGTASITVAVARSGKILWEEGFGWADRENRVPANEHTVYSLASVSKPITATALMTLVEAGKIDLDRPINDYLGNAKLTARVGSADDATVCRVGNHTSGLPRHFNFFYSDEPYVKPSMDETILRYGQLVALPGERYEYSNLGYGVIGYVISRVSGQSYEAYLRQAVFLKLGMTRSSVGVTEGLKRYQAVRYTRTGARIPFYDFDHQGASAVYSSAHDLIRFGMFHLGDRLSDQAQILSTASIERMRHPSCSSEVHENYGAGWRVERSGEYEIVFHGGWMPGVNDMILLVPSQRIALVLLANGDEGNDELRWAIANRILRALLPKWADFADRAPEAPEAFFPVPSLLGLWKGVIHTYRSQIPLELRFLPCGDIHAKIGDFPTTLIDAVSFRDNWLRGRLMGELDTDDANRMRPYTLRLELKLRNNNTVLNGSLNVRVPTHYELAQWTELHKVDEGSPH